MLLFSPLLSRGDRGGHMIWRRPVDLRVGDGDAGPSELVRQGARSLAESRRIRLDGGVQRRTQRARYVRVVPDRATGVLELTQASQAWHDESATERKRQHCGARG